MTNKRLEKLLKKRVPEIVQALISEGRLNIVKANLVKDEKTNLTIRIKPSMRDPVYKMR